MTGRMAQPGRSDSDFAARVSVMRVRGLWGRISRRREICHVYPTCAEAVAMSYALEPPERKAAKERQGTRTDIQLPEKFTGSQALDQVARTLGMSRPC